VLLDEEGQPACVFGAIQNITDVKEKEAALLQSQEDLRALTGRLIDVQESGMRELARELHDDLSQKLAALNMEISTLFPPSFRPSRLISKRIHELRVQIKNLASDVHTISHRLHPAILDELGLKIALGEECRDFAARTGFLVQFESEGESTWHARELSLCFYRVAQEGLHNIAKHAHATNVRVTLSSGEKSCALRIEDNGQGFDPNEAKGQNALGLISMQERARLANGVFRIKSEPGKGTTIEFSVARKEKLKRRPKIVPGFQKRKPRLRG
jgi:signal transduction histidine kinase